jgi:hypothetical protein
MYIPTNIVKTLHEERLKEFGVIKSKEEHCRIARFSLWSRSQHAKKKNRGISYHRITMNLRRFYLQAKVLLARFFQPQPIHQPTCSEEIVSSGC